MEETVTTYEITAGHRYPPGATVEPGGVNFSIFSQHATVVELLLYAEAKSPEPFQIIRLDPDTNRTFFYWHVFVEGLTAGTHYTWRVDGPDCTKSTGYRFNKNYELLDPWARAVTDEVWNRKSACMENRSGHSSIRGIVIDDDYDWEGDRPINHSLENSIIYEIHPGGFTRARTSGVSNPGTFAGIIEKIPYLKELGITDVELLPVMAFDEQELPEDEAKKGLRNFWGYMTHSFFSPHPGYCISPANGTHQREFRDMVKALHKAGIGVILDVVFNHTAEGGRDGPNINFKGFCNEVFYHLDINDKRKYLDYTGCGNTVSCNHPLVVSFITSCLEYWVKEMHVDGFRFDLASVLARGEDGEPMRHAPVLWNIEFSDVLAHTKIIAEAWDVGGLYQVGDFPGYRWAEWNGKYRDVIREFAAGGRGLIGEVATRISGSSDLYQPNGKLPVNSINYVTCHDGYTLYDLIEQNGSGGAVKGGTDDPDISFIRKKQAKNFMAILLLSQGVPMILGGDEVLRTQLGDPNAYCQDNEISWFDWRLVEQNSEMLLFMKEMIRFRKRHPSLMRKRFLTGLAQNGGTLPDITWHGRELNQPLWEDPDSRLLVFTLGATTGDEEDIHIIMNMSDHQENVLLPSIQGKRWYLTVDTGKASPGDINPASERIPIREDQYIARQGSVVVLESGLTK